MQCAGASGRGEDNGSGVAYPCVVVTRVGEESHGGAVAHATDSGVATRANGSSAAGPPPMRLALVLLPIYAAGAAAARAVGPGVYAHGVGTGTDTSAGGAGFDADGTAKARCCGDARRCGMPVKVNVWLSCQNCISREVKI